MKKTYKILLSVLLIGILSFGMLSISYADSNALEGYQVSSRGRLDYDANKDGDYEDNEDVVVDSRDFTMIANRLSNGKAVLSYALNAYPNVNLNQNDTFVNYAVAIANLTNLPSEKYYYDITTGVDDSSTIVRYVKEDANYYPCDEHGNKLSNTPASVDTSNLVAYTSATSNNASLGKACVANGKPVLGNGYDVWTVKKQIENGKAGIAEAITTAGVDTAADDSFEQMATNILLLKPTPPNPDDYEVVITYHEHTGKSSVKGGCYTVKKTKQEYQDCGTHVSINVGPFTDQNGNPYYYGICPTCNARHDSGSIGGINCNNQVLKTVTYYALGCRKTEETIESYKVYYKGEDVTN